MREHIFKARTSEKKWVHGLPLEKDEKLYIIDIKDITKLTEVEKDTLSEYTNRLMDDEETKIYENDIVEFRELYWTIVWDEALSGFQAQIIMPETDFPLILPLTQIIEGKIVGNKFDNPDLTNKKLE